MKKLSLFIAVSLFSPSVFADRCPQLIGNYGNCRLLTEENVHTQDLQTVTIQKNMRKRDGYAISVRLAGEQGREWSSVKERNVVKSLEGADRKIESMRCINDLIWIGTNYAGYSDADDGIVYSTTWSFRRSTEAADSILVKFTQNFTDEYSCELER